MQPIPATRMAPPAPRTIDTTPESIEGASFSFGGVAGVCWFCWFCGFFFWWVDVVDRCVRCLHMPPAVGCKTTGVDTFA